MLPLSERGKWSPVWGALDVFVKLVSVVLLAFAGAVLNRMRGSDGGILSLQGWMGYWPDHAMDRAVMAFPTGALLNVLSRDSLSSFLFTLVTWASLIVGWGTYFGIGEGTTGYNSRIGVFDWWFGREMDAGWSFGRRWTRDVAAMSMRGLLWTAPAGYLLHHRGLGWQYALSGAAMGFVYSIGQNADFHNPQSTGEFMFDGGVPWCESMWGWWIWLSIIAACTADRRTTGAATLGVGCLAWFEVTMFVCSVVFVISCFYYATVIQCDHKNWEQSFIGLFVCTVSLLAQQCYNYYGWHRFRARAQQYQTVSTHDESGINNEGDDWGGHNLGRSQGGPGKPL